MYHNSGFRQLEEGVLVFEDFRGERIATYDPLVEDSIQQAYDRIGIAFEHGMITPGRYGQFVDLLKENARERDEKLQLNPADRNLLNTHARYLERLEDTA